MTYNRVYLEVGYGHDSVIGRFVGGIYEIALLFAYRKLKQFVLRVFVLSHWTLLLDLRKRAP